MGEIDNAIVGEALSGDVGEIHVVTTQGQRLGSLDFGGSNVARLVVEITGVSKGSGGEFYAPVSIHTSDADHYIVSTLPEVSLEPVNSGRSQVEGI